MKGELLMFLILLLFTAPAHMSHVILIPVKAILLDYVI